MSKYFTCNKVPEITISVILHNYLPMEWDLEIQDEFDRWQMDQIWLCLAWYSSRCIARGWGWLLLVVDWLVSSEDGQGLSPYQTQLISSSWSSTVWSLWMEDQYNRIQLLLSNNYRSDYIIQLIHLTSKLPLILCHDVGSTTNHSLHQQQIHSTQNSQCLYNILGISILW